MLPPEPIKDIFFNPFVFFFTHFSTLAKISLFTDFLLFNKRTVPILKDFEVIIFPAEKTVISVLPPPTSTYK